ncbi:MAG: nucleotidyltransferase domain-containing protein [Acidimicrobiales bacterium]|nr:nucleotidyltransferase domain-containing protein [Acidimicrobiales bacterium]
MDLTSPLRSLTPTLDSAVLEVLAATESDLGVGRIAELAGRGTRQGLALAVDRLVEHGLVTATPANRGHLYRLNREHVLADAVLSACRARVTVLARLAEAVQDLDPQPVHASVFGSFARREAGPDSDIDVLFLLPDDVHPGDRWYEAVRALGDRVLAWTGNRMEYLAFTRAELATVVARGEPVVASWLADSITVQGDDIESLVRELETGRGRRR